MKKGYVPSDHNMKRLIEECEIIKEREDKKKSKRSKSKSPSRNGQTTEGKKKLKEKDELNALIAEKNSGVLAERMNKRKCACDETTQQLHTFNELKISCKGTEIWMI